MLLRLTYLVGGLLPVATNSQKGLMNKNMATIRIPSFAPGNYVKISLEYSTCSLCTLSFRRASASISTLISLSGVLANISKLYFQIQDFEIYSENKDNGYLYIVNVGSNTGVLYITPLNNSEEEYGISAELISSNSFIPDGKTKLSPLFSK